MKTSIHKFILYLAVAACLLALVLGSCSTLKSVGSTTLEIVEEVALPMVGGGVGAFVAGPGGAAIGAGALAVADKKIKETTDLKSGDIIGKEALEAETERKIREANSEAERRIAEANAAAERRIAEAAGEIGVLRTTLEDRPAVSKGAWKAAVWLLIAAGALLLWLKSHHMLALMSGGGLTKLLNIFLPSWMQKKLGLSQPKS